MILIENLYDYLIKIHVVHSLPGRLRLAIPSIREIPKAWQVDTFSVVELIEAIPGVNEATYSYVSGSAVILYDANIINEKKIIKHLKTMIRIVGAHRNQLEKTKVDQLGITVEKMKEVIKREMCL
ncbi:HMA2 domain-containing protein [Desulfosporosinus hippei]|uniref:Uncharacterized protein n=1 Tax=Desulfosporosinus hippei DSM 8344 TaxID=1121419 RepID=A0A1G7UFE4_9FIRM|nr:hypothetical protein [Desulfosporosinus hippei]SDG46204.1 hypothetical protein SAMN05443529_103127 [Desulfosporosinus hippei DSM 8344]